MDVCGDSATAERSASIAFCKSSEPALPLKEVEAYNMPNHTVSEVKQLGGPHLKRMSEAVYQVVRVLSSI